MSTCAANMTWISGRPGIMHEQRREPDEEREQAVEGRRLAPVPVDAGLPAERLAGGVGARQRHDAEAQERRPEQADREQDAGRLAGDRLEGLGGVGGAR